VTARPDRPSFAEVWARVHAAGEVHLVSSIQTPYRLTAVTMWDGRKALVAWPRSGRYYVHEDCFGSDTTCQGTRAGGIYNGPVNVWSWFGGKPVRRERA
jgi:hypothetical protein